MSMRDLTTALNTRIRLDLKDDARSSPRDWPTVFAPLPHSSPLPKVGL
jgi:hypothetical protein